MIDIAPPLILTLKLDAESFAAFDDLRREHFPPERNFLRAHVTLFHALPGEHESSIRETLYRVCVQTEAMKTAFPKLRFMGRGVAVELDCPPLIKLKNNLTKHWHAWLSAQDRQGFRPHVTIQNKVAPEEARSLYNHLAGNWQPLEGRGEGLMLWYYMGRNWKHAADFAFEHKHELSSTLSILAAPKSR